MSGDRKIILHAGMPKTGTSTIQNVLHANRDYLLRHEGALYPSLTANLNTPLLTIVRNDPLEHPANKLAGLTLEEAEDRRKGYSDSLDTEISSLDWNSLLLSAEGISNLSRPEIARLREWGENYASDWTVLVCVRHPVKRTSSVIQQRLKQGSSLKRLYRNPPAPNYRRKISNIISVFGRENVRIFDFDTAVKSEGGIVSAFAERAGLSLATGEYLASQAVRVNESLSLEAAQILGSLNRQRPIFVDGVLAPRRAGPRHEISYLRRIQGRKFDVPESAKENIRLQSRDDVAWLNDTFGLDLYEDVLEAAAQEGQEELVEASEDPVLDSIAGVIGDLAATVAFERKLNGGRAALSQGNHEGAKKMFEEAARLDPDSPQPKKLLEQVTAKQSRRFAGARGR